jgi:hypothetical protein
MFKEGLGVVLIKEISKYEKTDTNNFPAWFNASDDF